MQAVQTGRQDMEGRYRKARQLELQGTTRVQADTYGARPEGPAQPAALRAKGGWLARPPNPTLHTRNCDLAQVNEQAACRVSCKQGM